MQAVKGFTTFSDLVCPANSQRISSSFATSFWTKSWRLLRTAFPGLAGLVLMFLLFGCANDQSTSTKNQWGTGSGDIAEGPDGNNGLDLGDNWDASLNQGNNRLALPNSTSRSNRAPEPPRTQLNTNVENTWAIVLITYTHSNHLQDAAKTAATIRTTESLGPLFSSVRTHTNNRGSMVILGSYPALDDPKAKEDLAFIRSLVTPNGAQRIFKTVLMAFIESESQVISQYDLRTVRQRNDPNVTLYTLDVAIWSTFDEPNLDYRKLKRQAETHCLKLRKSGHEAYFYHNERAKISNVTVGVFPMASVDAQTGFYSVDVMRHIKLFPIRFNNNEPLEVLIDHIHPNRGTRYQSPVMVEIPK